MIDATTGLPLSGVVVALSGQSTASLTTDASGVFRFQNIPAGAYNVTLTLQDYGSLATSTVTKGGQLLSLGILPLTKSVGATTGTVRGMVKDAATGLPLSGVVVSVAGGSSANTDANGNYQIANVPAGVVSVTAALSGFAPASATVNLSAGGVYIFSPLLNPETNAGTVVQGSIRHGTTGAPLAGVTISVDGAVRATTDTSGAYRIDDVTAGLVSLRAELSGYDTVALTHSIQANTITPFSPALYPEGTTPDGVNTTGVEGIVLDAGANEPLAGATIQAIFGATSQAFTTDGQGRFRITDLPAANGTLAFSVAQYADLDLAVTLSPLEMLDAGQVRLRRASSAMLQPDFTAVSVDSQNVITDQQTLAVSGSLRVTVANQGTANAQAGVRVLAFYDANRNNVYDDGVDARLGEAEANTAITTDATEPVAVSVAGTLPFRDAPISVFVDSIRAVIESDETNNVGSTTGVCEVRPPVGTFNPVVKYQALRGIDIVATPVVINLTDDNGDGRIDQNDIPDVAVTSSPGNQFAGGPIRAFSGDDGRVLFTTPSNVLLATLNDIAAADIDGDGIPELVAAHNDNRHLVAFTNTGAVKWMSDDHPLPGRSDSGGAISIANLDGQGAPEIIIGASVYSATGRFLGDGRSLGGTSGFNLYTAISVVADINLDGIPEIIAGPSAYQYVGGQLRLLWRNTALADGLVGIGNFNADPYPEIVLVAQGRAYLLNHQGAVIWGPVLLPGGGNGGAPTIGDFDADGQPEIGVAGASRYVVFETNGSVKWTSVTQDISSHTTGSTSFDFEGDGAAEVIYRDERFLRIYRGSTGAILFQRPMRSGTATEYPLVADVNNDGHAEIIVPSDRRAGGTIEDTGVYVIGNADNSWVPTRTIWNQHSYHITNINDDGSVPQVEANSWQAHNTYRLNAFPDRSPFSTADLTASRIRITTSETGAISLTVRIGNAGAAPSSSNVLARFYNGDPTIAGTLIGQVSVPALRVGEYADVTLTHVTGLEGSVTLYAVVDPDNRVPECRENNNTTSAPFLINVRGTISVSTDQPVYGPHAAATLQGEATNSGAVAADFTAQLRIEDLQGALVAEFPAQPLYLAGGASSNAINVWNTGTTLAGTYRLRGFLRDAVGGVVAESTSTFGIRHDIGQPRITLRVTTDWPTYNVTDIVSIESLIGNTTLNSLLEDTRLRLRIKDSNDTVVFTHEGALGQVPPGALRNVLLPYSLTNPPVGLYQIEGEVIDAGTGEVLAVSSAQYRVVNDLTRNLAGQVTVATAQVERGAAQVCTYAVTNHGPDALNGLALRMLTVAIADETAVETFNQNVSLAPAGGTQTIVRTVATQTLSPGDYACVLQALLDGDYRTLGFAAFSVVQPPIRIDAAMTIGDKGRVLVLLDGQNRCAPDENGNNGNSQSCLATSDPHGPSGAPPLDTQRTFLEALLTQAGWSYTITESADAFTGEFRSGAYNAYVLFSEQEKLSEQVQRELREAVFRGEGLVMAGSHDHRHLHRDKLLDALSLDIHGHDPNARDVELTPSPLGVSGYLPLLSGDQMLRLEITQALSAGRYVQHSPGNRNPDAVTFHTYGSGKSAFFAFDLLALATRDGSESLAAQALLGAIQATHPAPLQPRLGSVMPVRLTLNNQGVATTAAVTTAIPWVSSFKRAAGKSKRRRPDKPLPG